MAKMPRVAMMYREKRRKYKVRVRNRCAVSGRARLYAQVRRVTHRLS